MNFRNLKRNDQFKFYEIAGVYVKLNEIQAMSDKGKVIHVNPNEEIIKNEQRNDSNSRKRNKRH